MTRKHTQLPLQIPPLDQRDLLNLAVGPSNARALEVLHAWPQWPAPFVVFWGASGSGKTHLAEIWASQARPLRLVGNMAQELPEQAENDHSPILIDPLPEGQASETALFHILNLARAQGRQVLMTSRDPFDDRRFALPDLASRLKSALWIEVGSPDDAMLRQVLVKLFADRQMRVEPHVVEFIANRMERSLAAANAIVADLDERSLSLRRPVTRALAAETLEKIGEPEFEWNADQKGNGDQF